MVTGLRGERYNNLHNKYCHNILNSQVTCCMYMEDEYMQDVIYAGTHVGVVDFGRQAQKKAYLWRHVDVIVMCCA